MRRTSAYLAGHAIVINALTSRLGDPCIGLGPASLAPDQLHELLAGGVDGARDYAAGATSHEEARQLLDESMAWVRNGGVLT